MADIGARFQQVREQIREAFKDVPYPGDDNIVAYQDDESEDLRESLRGRRWEEVPLDTLKYHRDNLPLLAPAGLQYFLPAFLLAALADVWDILDFVILELAPEYRPGYYAAKFERFTPAQKSAVRAFLELILDERPTRCVATTIAPAIEKYWAKADEP